jgi:glycosyltransferase involved in cell wall biosynthesis
MRILLISLLNPAIVPGGEQQVAYEMFRAARERGHEAWLLSAMPEWPQYRRFGKPSAPIAPMEGAEREYLYFPKFYDHQNLSVIDSHSSRFLKDFIAHLRPDVIQFHHYAMVGVEAIRIARLAAPQAVIGMAFHEMMAICVLGGHMVTPNGTLCERATPISCSRCCPDLRPEFFQLRAARLKYYFSECDLFVFPSEFVKLRYLDWGLPTNKCAMIPNGQKNIGDSNIRELHSLHCNRFGFFGQLMDDKGADVLVRAVLSLAQTEKIHRNGIVIELNGANKEWATPSYIEKFDKLLQEARACFPLVEVLDRGPYPHGMLRERMASCDWVVVPSTWWEIFGLVVSEAWMCGRPVLASDIGGLGERVHQGVNGLTFPAKDVSALASLISMAAGNKELWHKLSASITPPNTDHQMLDQYMVEWSNATTKRLDEVGGFVGRV